MPRSGPQSSAPLSPHTPPPLFAFALLKARTGTCGMSRTWRNPTAPLEPGRLHERCKNGIYCKSKYFRSCYFALQEKGADAGLTTATHTTRSLVSQHNSNCTESYTRAPRSLVSQQNSNCLRATRTLQVDSVSSAMGPTVARACLACLAIAVAVAGAGAVCPPPGFDALKDLSVSAYISAPWYVQQQVGTGTGGTGCRLPLSLPIHTCPASGSRLPDCLPPPPPPPPLLLPPSSHTPPTLPLSSHPPPTLHPPHTHTMLQP